MLLDEPTPAAVPAVNATGRYLNGGERVLVMFAAPHGVWVSHLLSTPEALYAARVYRSAAYSNLAAAVTTTALSYDTIEYGDTYIETGSGSALYVAPVDGYYWVNARHEMQINNNPEENWLSIYVNGSEVRRGTSLIVRNASAGDVMSFQVNGLISASAADEIGIRVTHNQGGNAIAQNSGTDISYAEFCHA